MVTPFFLIHKDQLLKNIVNFREGMSIHWGQCRISYSVKTNSLPWILQFMNQQGVMAEVVSDEEYALALKCGFLESNIVFNGPIKSKDIFLHAIEKDSFVNIDSQRELEWLSEISLRNKTIGIRINVPPELFDSKDIEYAEEGFRFGFSDSNNDLSDAITYICNKGCNGIGFHLHCNSITRSINVYRSIVRYAAEMSEKYRIDLAYLDIGGGFFGGVPGKPNASDYFSVIADEMKKIERFKDTLLISEPGSALIGSVVDYYTTVLDVKNTSKSRIVTTDGSRIHIDPLWKKTRYMYSLRTNSLNTYKGSQVVCGYTCMDHDRIMILQNEPELKVGDNIIYHRVGAYSMTFGGMFIRYYPEVYVQTDENSIEMIRRRITVEEYYQIEGV